MTPAKLSQSSRSRCIHGCMRHAKTTAFTRLIFSTLKSALTAGGAAPIPMGTSCIRTHHKKTLFMLTDIQAVAHMLQTPYRCAPL